MNLKEKKIILNNKLFKVLTLATLFFQCINLNIYSEENSLYEELELNQSNDLGGEKNLDLPTNPFELVEMIRRANSLNDATRPTDAIDEAIKSFDMIDKEESL